MISQLPPTKANALSAILTPRKAWRGGLNGCFGRYSLKLGLLDSRFLIWRTLIYTRTAATHTETAANAALEMVEEAKKTTIAANEATDEAKKTNEIAAQSTAAEQRAWVTIKASIAWFEISENTVKADIRFAIKNSGVLPALSVNILAKIQCSDGNVGPSAINFFNEEYGWRVKNNPTHAGVIAPNDEIEFRKVLIGSIDHFREDKEKGRNNSPCRIDQRYVHIGRLSRTNPP